MVTIVKQDVYISRMDRLRLERIIQAQQSAMYRDASYLEHLDKRLQHAHFVNPGDIPPDVVTMNSRVRLWFPDANERRVYAVVFPEHADLAVGRLSVLAPLGAALLGAREGDEVVWETPDGERTVVVEAILYQPEAKGDYHM